MDRPFKPQPWRIADMARSRSGSYSLASLLAQVGELPDDQIRALWTGWAQAWLERKWGRERPCPYCGVVQWQVQMEPVYVQSWIDNRMFPSLQVMCGNCSQFVLLSAQDVDLGELT